MKVTQVIQDSVVKAQAALKDRITKIGDKFTLAEVQAGIELPANVAALEADGVNATILRDASFSTALAALLNGESLEVEPPAPIPPKEVEAAAAQKVPPLGLKGAGDTTTPADESGRVDALSLENATSLGAPPVGEQEENSTASQGGWKSYGTLVLGALGILAWIGSLFSSEEGSKGKAVFAGIGGLLFGGALLSQWPSIGNLFGRAIEAVKGVVQPDNGAATETH